MLRTTHQRHRPRIRRCILRDNPYIPPPHLATDFLQITTHPMHLKPDKTCITPIINQMRRRHPINPRLNRIPNRLNSIMVPSLRPKCRPSRRILRQIIQPTPNPLLKHTRTPSPIRRINFNLIPMHPTILIIRPARRPNLNTRIQHRIHPELQLQHKIPIRFLRAQKCIRRIRHRRTHQHTINHLKRSLPPPGNPSRQTLPIKQINPRLTRHLSPLQTKHTQ